MRILIHCLNFAPELVGCGKYTGEMAEWLAARGHELRVVTAPPFNPQWKVAPGFSAWRYACEDRVCPSYLPKRDRRLRQWRMAVVPVGGSRSGESVRGFELPAQGSESQPSPPQDSGLQSIYGGLRILRCPLWVPLQPSSAKRILHLASFAIASSPVMLRQASWKPDVVLVVEPTLFCLPAAEITARLCGARSWLHVQDFEADAGFELGLLHSSALRRTVDWLEKKVMSGFGRVSTISEKMVARLEEKAWPDRHDVFSPTGSIPAQSFLCPIPVRCARISAFPPPKPWPFTPAR